MNFSQIFLEVLIWGALVWTLLGALVLVALLVNDWKNGRIW